MEIKHRIFYITDFVEYKTDKFFINYKMLGVWPKNIVVKENGKVNEEFSLVTYENNEVLAIVKIIVLIVGNLAKSNTECTIYTYLDINKEKVLEQVVYNYNDSSKNKLHNLLKIKYLPKEEMKLIDSLL